MSEIWSAPFLDYFNNNIHPDIESLARWAIESYGVYCPFSGIINNQAEGINLVLKQLQQWKEAPIDCMVLALNYVLARLLYFRNSPWSAETRQLSSSF